MIPFRYDGAQFIKGLDEFAKTRLQKHKTHKQIRYALYRIWTLGMIRADIATEIQHPNFAWPPVVLDYIRGLLPEDCKCEIFQNNYPVSLEMLLMTNEIKKVEENIQLL